MTRLSQVIVCTAVFTILAQILYWCYPKQREVKKKQAKKKEINEVIMFSAERSIARPSRFKKHAISPSLDRLTFYLTESRYTLDICMYVFTNAEIAKTVSSLIKTGVQIRMIVDGEMAFASGSYVKKLEKLGATVRTLRSTNLMHHKFCVVDASTELLPLGPMPNVVPYAIAGSLNWTIQGIHGNWEDVVVTSQYDIVKAYKQEFEKLWELFKPCNC